MKEYVFTDYSMKMKKLIGTLYKILFVVPLVVGVASYLYAGENFSDALYYSIHLYGLSYEKPEISIVWLEIARWLAPLMTAASIMVVIKSLFSYLKVCVGAVSKKNNVVYGDSIYADILCSNEKNVFLCKGLPIRYAKNHLVMFDSDIENLSFCQKYSQQMKGKNIYVCMNEMDSNLLKEQSALHIKFFNPNDVIAREFWRSLKLWDVAPLEYKIAIVGFGNLGKRMLEKALQLNIYAEEQKIQYYVFGNAKHFKVSHTNMSLMNQDQILYIEKESEEQWEILKSMDLIILTEQTEVNLIQNILNCSDPMCKVYYYSPNDDKLRDFIETDRLLPYGNSKEVFTLENIKTDNLYQNAIKLNQQYVDKYHTEEWEQLTGFFKDSNISSADYGNVIMELYKKGLNDTTLAKLEHIRWCRFHFLRYWRYGVPENGDSKDTGRKIHKSLIPFEKLDNTEQEKDYDTINTWKEILIEDK